MEATLTTSPAILDSRTLILADWKADPHRVVAACTDRLQADHASVDLVVPAVLHGIDWVGDPHANVPCAQRALDELTRLLRSAGVEVASARVGDHDPVAAAIDATLFQPTRQIVVCGLERRVKLLDLGRRVSRATRRPVLSVAVPPADRRRHGWLRLEHGECGMTQRIAPVSKAVVL
jgi:hypothetical protein